MSEDIVVFGVGKYFRTKLENIRKKYHIIAILDNALADRDFSDEFDCYIYNPKQWNLLPDCPIVIMSVHFIEMSMQLVSLGVPCERIIFGQSMKPFYDSYEELLFSRGGGIRAAKDRLCYIFDGRETFFCTDEDYRAIKRKVFLEYYPEIGCWNQFSSRSIDPNFGIGRGRAVDRVYIERFIEEHKKDIQGTVMEIQDNRYMQRYGEGRIKKELILHVEGGKNCIKGNFATGEGLKESMANCLICTQTLQYIYDLRSTAKNIYKILKKNGVALVTVPGIKSLSAYHDAQWGEYWSFTKRSLYQMFVDVFGEENMEISSYGNVKVTMAYLYGLCAEELDEEDFHFNDENFPFIVTARLQKGS